MLAAAIDALAAGFPVPVTLALTDERLPESLEASVYFIVAEALTNVVKARAGTDPLFSGQGATCQISFNARPFVYCTAIAKSSTINEV